MAITHYRARRRRDVAFGQDGALFGDPAWDILLDLFAAWLDGKRVSISSACIAAAVPPTTGLRYLGMLEDRGLIERDPDPHDRRRSFVRVTPQAVDALNRWVASCGRDQA